MRSLWIIYNYVPAMDTVTNTLAYKNTHPHTHVHKCTTFKIIHLSCGFSRLGIESWNGVSGFAINVWNRTHKQPTRRKMRIILNITKERPEGNWEKNNTELLKHVSLSQNFGRRELGLSVCQSYLQISNNRLKAVMEINPSTKRDETAIFGYLSFRKLKITLFPHVCQRSESV